MIWPVHTSDFVFDHPDLHVVNSSLVLLLMLSEVQELFIYTNSAVQ